MESHRATWARFSSRPRALQTKRRHRHGSFCRSKRARHAAAPTQFVWGRGVASCDVGQFFKPPKGSSDPAPATAWRPRRSKLCKTRCRAVHRFLDSAASHRATWASFQAAQGLFSPPSAGNGMAPLAAVSVQGTLPYRPQVCCECGVESCDLGQIFKRPRALRLRSYLDLEGRRPSHDPLDTDDYRRSIPPFGYRESLTSFDSSSEECTLTLDADIHHYDPLDTDDLRRSISPFGVFCT